MRKLIFAVVVSLAAACTTSDVPDKNTVPAAADSVKIDSSHAAGTDC